MLNFLLLLLVPFLVGAPTSGNPVPASFPAARQAARDENRPIAIFFAPPGCTSCETHWQEYLASGNARGFIPLKLNTEDFDARAILEAWGPDKVPGWTILEPNGSVRDRWSGTWNKTPLPYQPAPAKPSASSSTANTQKDTPVLDVPVTTAPARATPEPSPAPATAPADGFRVQVGVFGSKANADKLVQDLSKGGQGSFDILTGQNAKGPFYRVVSAVYAQETDARAASASLEQQGVKNAVKRVSEL
jgi:DedD protein